EGCVVRTKKRPKSYVLNFSFSHQELELAERVRTLLKKCLGVTGRLVLRETTLGVAVGKASAALLLKTLAGGRSSQKRVPPCIFTAGSDQIRAFLDALVE